MLEDSERLLSTIEQVLRTGRVGPSNRIVNSAPVDISSLLQECVARARTLYNLPSEPLQLQMRNNMTVLGDIEELRAAISNDGTQGTLHRTSQYIGSRSHRLHFLSQQRGLQPLRAVKFSVKFDDASILMSVPRLQSISYDAGLAERNIWIGSRIWVNAFSGSARRPIMTTLAPASAK